MEVRYLCALVLIIFLGATGVAQGGSIGVGAGYVVGNSSATSVVNDVKFGYTGYQVHGEAVLGTLVLQSTYLAGSIDSYRTRTRTWRFSDSYVNNLSIAGRFAMYNRGKIRFEPVLGYNSYSHGLAYIDEGFIINYQEQLKGLFLGAEATVQPVQPLSVKMGLRYIPQGVYTDTERTDDGLTWEEATVAPYATNMAIFTAAADIQLGEHADITAGYEKLVAHNNQGTARHYHKSPQDYYVHNISIAEVNTNADTYYLQATCRF